MNQSEEPKVGNSNQEPPIGSAQPSVSTPIPSRMAGSSEGGKNKTVLYLLLGVLVGAVVVFGAWYVFIRSDEAETPADTSPSESTQESEEEPEPTDPQLGQANLDSIAVAIGNKKYSDLNPYLADNVEYAVAASEYGVTKPKGQLLTEFEYLESATSPWNFRLGSAELDGYKNSESYGKFFAGEILVGKSANNYLISFGFTNSKISRILVSSDANIIQ